MSRTRYRNNMPPGLKAQIAFAVLITLGALFGLPTALSATEAVTSPSPAQTVEMPSAGTVSTTLTDFSASDFQASSFSDWD